MSHYRMILTYREEVRVVKKANQIGFCGLLQSQNGARLEAQVGLKVLKFGGKFGMVNVPNNA